MGEFFTRGQHQARPSIVTGAGASQGDDDNDDLDDNDIYDDDPGHPAGLTVGSQGAGATYACPCPGPGPGESPCLTGWRRASPRTTPTC